MLVPQRRRRYNPPLPYSTMEFRNAFLKTIRQIIRESVRNMSIPSTKQHMGHHPGMSMAPRMSTGHVEKFERQSSREGQTQNGNAVQSGTLSKKAVKQQLLASMHTSKRKYGHAKQSVEHESSEDKDTDEPATTQTNPTTTLTFRSRSKTISDTSGKDTHGVEFCHIHRHRHR